MAFLKNDTNIMKGIAICMLLWHHLFYPSNIEITFVNRNIPEIIAYYSKVCVAIFVFLSGFGLYKSYNKRNLNIKEFYKRSLKKLYLNYWFIWIIFVPIGIVFFQRSLNIVYGENIIKNIIINLLGVQTLFGQSGYNVTWWYMGLVVGLYLIYPLINLFIKKAPVTITVVTFLLLYVEPKPILGLNFIGLYGEWLFPFVLGAIWSKYNMFEKIASIKINKGLKFTAYSVILLFILVCRKDSTILYYTKIDGFFTIVVIQMIFEYLIQIKIIDKVFGFIGEHSFNIFLTHTFIYMYYFNDFIYSLSNPILIFMVLLISSLSISVMIEKIKYRLRILINSKCAKNDIVSMSNS